MPAIKQQLDEGKVVRVVFMGALSSPKLIEVVAIHGNWDGIFLDQEHTGMTQRELEARLMAARASGMDALVRVAPTDYGTVMRPMESGAGGVMVAQIRTVDQVEKVVKWAKYPPVGVRGMFGANIESGYGSTDVAEHVVRANHQRWLSIQIETAEAVDCVDQIAAVEHVDNLFVGPSDLACALGVPGEVMHPRCVAALERLSAAARAEGKSWGILPHSCEHVQKCLDLGCQLFCVGGDLDLVRRGVDSIRQTYSMLF